MCTPLPTFSNTKLKVCALVVSKTRSICSFVQLLAVRQVEVMTWPRVAVSCWILASNTTPVPFGSGCAAAAYVAGPDWVVPGVAQVEQSISTRTATLPVAAEVCEVPLLLPLTWVSV